MKIILKSYFGSKLYGVNNKNSDLDIKIVFIPDIKDVLFKKYKDNFVKKNDGNDISYISIFEFFKLCKNSSPHGIELLHTPKESIILKTKEWDQILKNKEKLYSTNIKPFIGFSISQIERYKKKRININQIDQVIEILKRNKKEKIKTVKSPFIKKIEKNGEVFYSFYKTILPENAKAEILYNSLIKLRSQFGKRSLESLDKNYDSKSLYHAVRLLDEAIELLEDKKITLPLKNKDFILKIRNQEVSIKEIEKKIEEKLIKINELKNKIKEVKYDDKFEKSFIIDIYKGSI